MCGKRSRGVPPAHTVGVGHGGTGPASQLAVSVPVKSGLDGRTCAMQQSTTHRPHMWCVGAYLVWRWQAHSSSVDAPTVLIHVPILRPSTRARRRIRPRPSRRCRCLAAAGTWQAHCPHPSATLTGRASTISTSRLMSAGQRTSALMCSSAAPTSMSA